MPKTYKNLWPQLISFANLHSAYRAARRGKRSTPAVASFEYAAEDELFALQDALTSGSYVPGEYHVFKVRHRGKQRVIAAAPFRDRVVHHALCQQIEPIWERRFIHDSYACRVGKGTHAAIKRAQQYTRRYRYVLQLDVQQFFPSIDHAMLLQQLQRHLADPQVLALCAQIIASGTVLMDRNAAPQYFAGDDFWAAERPRGLPIGNLTSQFWANVYLHALDSFIKEQLHCRAYVRYCDDLLLFSNSKAELWHWRTRLTGYAADELRLRFHARRGLVATANSGIPWLGWVVYPQQLRLKRRCGIDFQRRLRRLVRAYQRGVLPLEQVTASVQGWVAHAAFGSTYGLRRALLEAVVLEAT